MHIGVSPKTLWQRRREEYLSLLRLGLPVLVTQIGIIVVSFADTAMVGRYGVNELAASAFVNNIFMVPVVCLIGFAAGVTPLVGALFGREDYDGVGNMSKAALQVNVVVACILMALMTILYFFLDCFGQPEELLPLIRRYYLIVLFTLIPVSIFNCLQQMCNGVTDTASPMVVMLSINCMNIVGNYLLIFGNFGFPQLGLSGAGISTLLARIAGALAMLWLVMRSRRYGRYRRGFSDSERDCGKNRMTVLRTSFPIMVQSGVEASLWSFGAVVSGWFGKIELASYQVTNIIAQLGFMTFMSFAVATSVRVANFCGVKDVVAMRRISVAGLHLNLVLATCAMILFLVAGRHLIGIFTDNSEVINLCVLLIPPLILYQYGDAAQLTYANALRGTGNVSPLLWISIVSYVVVGVSVLLLFAKGFGWGTVGIYYSFSLALFTAGVLLYLTFRRTLQRI
ncbi:MAG: MATE family efflux transporter [Bacteroidales bacterium]|nr:MATE family efflux transporter [Bacteroidales bacterium]